MTVIIRLSPRLLLFQKTIIKVHESYHSQARRTLQRPKGNFQEVTAVGDLQATPCRTTACDLKPL